MHKYTIRRLETETKNCIYSFGMSAQERDMLNSLVEEEKTSRAKLLRRLIYEKAAGPWMPITSAPMDGTTVLACCAGTTCRKSYPIPIKWHTERWRDVFGNEVEPVWWAPLPTPPPGGYT